MKTTSITTDKAMTTIANNIEKKLNDGLRIFTNRKIKFIRVDYNDARRILVYDEDCDLSSTFLETIQKIVRPYEKKYAGVSYSLSAYPYMFNGGEWFYAPCIEVYVKMENE